jgi:hypothetical protein
MCVNGASRTASSLSSTSGHVNATASTGGLHDGIRSVVQLRRTGREEGTARIRPKPDRAPVTRNPIGKNPLRLVRGRPLIAVADRVADGVSLGVLSLHVAPYAPCELVSRKPRTLRRSLITVSDIVGPPHRVHSIAIFPASDRHSTERTLIDQLNESRTIIDWMQPPGPRILTVASIQTISRRPARRQKRHTGSPKGWPSRRGGRRTGRPRRAARVPTRRRLHPRTKKAAYEPTLRAKFGRIGAPVALPGLS